MTQHIICFGDSITRGENDHESGGWVDRLKTFSIEKFLETKADETCVFNMGIGGETTEGLIKRFRSELDPRLSQDGNNVVLLGYGTNDLALVNGEHVVPEETFQSNLNDCIDYALQHQAKVFLVNILPVMGIQLEKRKRKNIIRYNQLILSIANNKNVGHIDVFKPFESQKDAFITFDGLHPNARGHQLIYEVVKKAVLQ